MNTKIDVQPNFAWIAEREAYLHLAIEEARLAAAEGEVPVGAVLVHDGKILVRAHNRCQQDNDPTAHAELLCIRDGAKQRCGRLTDCTLYVTMEPCAMCAGAAINAKLDRLVFGAFDMRAGCCGSVFDLTDHCFLHTVEVWGGVLATECAALLTDFFVQQRG
ncbi:MAG: tRNA adenosine(34) deaminase TadA [Clostridia bacterium]